MDAVMTKTDAATLTYEQMIAELQQIKVGFENRAYSLQQEEEAYARAGELFKVLEARLLHHQEVINTPLFGGVLAVGGGVGVGAGAAQATQ
jgi:exonuclease VII small subunit